VVAAAPTPAGARLSGDAFLASLPPDPRTRGDTHGGPGAALPMAPLPGGAAANGGRPAAVLVLHGSASSGAETLDVVRALLLLTPRLRTYTHWVAPTAVAVDGDTGSWFGSTRNASAPGGRSFDGPALSAAAARIEAIVANEGGRGVPRGRVAVVGFSQGGALALEVGRRLGMSGGGAPLAGWVVGAGFVADVGRWGGVTGLRGRLLMLHGADDAVVPLAAARESAGMVAAAGWNVTFEVLPNEGHVITSPNAVGQALAFLFEVLPP